jgi:prevent-host-death family protein
MKAITVRELRNNGADVLDRVEAGESLTVTRSGRAVATLTPLTTRQLSAAGVLRQWRHAPHVNPSALRRDLDDVADSRL